MQSIAASVEMRLPRGRMAFFEMGDLPRAAYPNDLCDAVGRGGSALRACGDGREQRCSWGRRVRRAGVGEQRVAACGTPAEGPAVLRRLVEEEELALAVAPRELALEALDPPRVALLEVATQLRCEGRV